MLYWDITVSFIGGIDLFFNKPIILFFFFLQIKKKAILIENV